MKRGWLLIVITLTTWCNAAEKTTAKATPTCTPWYHSYKKAILTGSIIGALTTPIKPFGYAIIMITAGEGSATDVFNKFMPNMRKSLIISTASGALAACFVVGFLKAFDLGTKSKKQRMEKLYEKITPHPLM